MAKKPADYAVGYGKPPAHTRFRKGHSGNPRGRPKGALNLATDLAEELGERIRVREGDRELSVTKQRAMLKALVARALKGDARAANAILALIARLVEPDSTASKDDEMSPFEQETLDAFIARLAGPSSMKSED